MLELLVTTITLTFLAVVIGPALARRRPGRGDDRGPGGFATTPLPLCHGFDAGGLGLGAVGGDAGPGGRTSTRAIPPSSIDGTRW